MKPLLAVAFATIQLPEHPSMVEVVYSEEQVEDLVRTLREAIENDGDTVTMEVHWWASDEEPVGSTPYWHAIATRTPVAVETHTLDIFEHVVEGVRPRLSRNF